MTTLLTGDLKTAVAANFTHLQIGNLKTSWLEFRGKLLKTAGLEAQNLYWTLIYLTIPELK